MTFRKRPLDLAARWETKSGGLRAVYRWEFADDGQRYLFGNQPACENRRCSTCNYLRRASSERPGAIGRATAAARAASHRLGISDAPRVGIRGHSTTRRMPSSAARATGDPITEGLPEPRAIAPTLSTGPDGQKVSLLRSTSACACRGESALK